MVIFVDIWLRCKLELLGTLVSLYRVIRESGKTLNEGVVPPIDALVGLRFATAAIQASKEYPAIIQNR